jgi:hypothetical protein
MEKHRELSWPHIFAEGVAIVVSILLAFSIEAWWQDRGEGQREREILFALLDDFEISKANINEGRDFHLAIQRSNTKLLRAVTSSEISLTDEEIERLVVEISWWDGRSHFSTGALNSLVFGGDIAVIENSTLRRLVADWPSQIEYVELAQRQDYDFFFNVWTPFLRANSYLPQQSTLGASMPGIPNARAFEIDLKIKDRRSYANMVVNEEFHNILAQKSWIQFDILEAFDKADALLDQMIQHIESTP